MQELCQVQKRLVAVGALPRRDARPALTACGASFVVAFAGLSLLAMGLNRRRLQVRDALTWFAFLALALGAQRIVAIFGIVIIPALLRNLNSWLDQHPLSEAARLSAAAAVALVLAILATDVSVQSSAVLRRRDGEGGETRTWLSRGVGGAGIAAARWRSAASTSAA